VTKIIDGVEQGKFTLIKKTERTSYPRWYEKFKTAYDNHMQNWSILDALLPSILYHRDGCLVEIGVGNSTFFMCKHAHEFDRKLYSCDINSSKLKKLASNHEVYLMPSEDFIEDFDKNPAVVLIDADHSYKTAKMEFDFFFDKLVDGGVIFIHDTYPPEEELVDEPRACGDVYKLRQELEKRDDMDVFTWPYGGMWMGLTMVIKKEKDRPRWGE